MLTKKKKKARGNIRQAQIEGRFPKQLARTLQRHHSQERQRKAQKFVQIKGGETCRLNVIRDPELDSEWVGGGGRWDNHKDHYWGE